MGQLAFDFFTIMFPLMVVNFLVKETNDYQTFCDAPPPEGKEDKREERHKKKKSTLGHASWPKEGITLGTMYAVIGIVLTLGLVRLPEMIDHWDKDVFHDFLLVRNSMSRDMFLLIYSRFFHMAPAPSPKRHRDGSYDEGWDALWHIRTFETMLNQAWSGACLVGRWLSFDEQMILCVHRTAKFMTRYMPKKPIKNGLKLWAVACFTGYCFLSYTDGGFVGDPKLRGWASCPLGRTCRMVLFVLFGACDEFATQLRQSGTYMAMDNFFSSPILFLCLLWHGIFAVGTLKDIHRGASQAVQYWTVTRQTPRKKGDMVFARFGFLAFAQWKDSKLVRLLSTIHVKKSDFIPIPYSKFAAGDKKEDSWQPLCRFHYNKFMVGVDLADQLNGYYQSLHKSKNYFWRRVFEQKLMQACSNAWLLYRWWLDDMLAQVKAEIATLNEGGHADGDTAKEGLQLAALLEEQADLERLRKKSRVQWLRALAKHLLSQSTSKLAAKGGRRPAPAPFKKTADRHQHVCNISRRRDCSSPGCKGSPTPKTKAPKRARRAKVSQACFCLSCRSVGGVVICTPCHADDNQHQAAYRKTADRMRTKAAHKRKPLVQKKRRVTI
ncbi:unnamed protein product [Pylaiella littoralis]